MQSGKCVFCLWGYGHNILPTFDTQDSNWDATEHINKRLDHAWRPRGYPGRCKWCKLMWHTFNSTPGVKDTGIRQRSWWWWLHPSRSIYHPSRGTEGDRPKTHFLLFPPVSMNLLFLRSIMTKSTTVTRPTLTDEPLVFTSLHADRKGASKKHVQ
jgi:hypothetical protein